MQEQKQLNRRALLFLLFLSIVPALTFWPGTNGTFLVDDFDNLRPISDHGGITSVENFKKFVLTGVSGPTGRPVSLASFVIDAQEWPADPHSFKRTNILIHSLNGIILFAVILKLFQLYGKRDSTALNIAFLGAALWMLHPLNTSTVLYVIQRMTELSALFSLIGIWCYLHGRQMLNSNPGTGYLWMTGGVVACGALATLSKETGVLLPFYIAAIEFTVLRSVNRPKYFFYWFIPMVAFPIAMLLGYLGTRAMGEGGYSVRSFTLYERLLTQPRILFHYIGSIFFPNSLPTLAADDIPISRGLLEPITTIPAIIAINAILIVGFASVKRFPVLALGILWFMAGHLLESTVLSLEMYFEHRNYMPMIGLIIAAVYYLHEALSTDRKKVIAVSTIVLSALTVTTWSYSTTWGDHSRLVDEWAHSQPHSARAQILLVLKTIHESGYPEALEVFNKARPNLPNTLGLDFLYTDLICVNNKLDQEWFNTLLHRAAYTNIDQYVQQSLNQLMGSIFRKNCKQIPIKGLEALVDNLLANSVTPPLEKRDAALQMVKAEIYLTNNQPIEALKAIDESFRIMPSINLALKQAHILIQGKQYDAALIQLNKAEALDRLRPKHMPSHIARINQLRKMLTNPS